MDTMTFLTRERITAIHMVLDGKTVSFDPRPGYTHEGSLAAPLSSTVAEAFGRPELGMAVYSTSYEDLQQVEEDLFVYSGQTTFHPQMRRDDGVWQQDPDVEPIVIEKFVVSDWRREG